MEVIRKNEIIVCKYCPNCKYFEECVYKNCTVQCTVHYNDCELISNCTCLCYYPVEYKEGE